MAYRIIVSRIASTTKLFPLFNYGSFLFSVIMTALIYPSNYSHHHYLRGTFFIHGSCVQLIFTRWTTKTTIDHESHLYNTYILCSNTSHTHTHAHNHVTHCYRFCSSEFIDSPERVIIPPRRSYIFLSTLRFCRGRGHTNYRPHLARAIFCRCSSASRGDPHTWELITRQASVHENSKVERGEKMRASYPLVVYIVMRSRTAKCSTSSFLKRNGSYTPLRARREFSHNINASQTYVSIPARSIYTEASQRESPWIS